MGGMGLQCIHQISRLDNAASFNGIAPGLAKQGFVVFGVDFPVRWVISFMLLIP